jgi:hypothetical protein
VRIWAALLILLGGASAAQAQLDTGGRAQANGAPIQCLTAASPITQADNNFQYVLCDSTGHLLISGGGGGGGSVTQGTSPWVTQSIGATITQTRVTLAAATSATLIAANSTRKSLRWQNTGTAPMTCGPGTGTIVAGVGMNYDPGSSSTNQGGGTNFQGEPVPTNAFACVSTLGTTVTVWEGN